MSLNYIEGEIAWFYFVSFHSYIMVIFFRVQDYIKHGLDVKYLRDPDGGLHLLRKKLKFAVHLFYVVVFFLQLLNLSLKLNNFLFSCLHSVV